MPRSTAAVAFLPLLLVTALAFGQAPAAPSPTRQPGVGPSLVQAGDAPARERGRSHPDADARECLEYLTNTGVIRCAETYRRRGARATH